LEWGKRHICIKNWFKVNFPTSLSCLLRKIKFRTPTFDFALPNIISQVILTFNVSKHVPVYTVSQTEYKQSWAIITSNTKICNLSRHPDSNWGKFKMIYLYLNTLTSGHIKRRDCSPMRC
jgi:hypothetical protein